MTRDDPPGAALRRAVRGRDLVALAVAPAVLLGAYALPTGRKRSLTFSYVDPSALTAFTAHYVHLDPAHLLGNLAGYLLLAVTGYLLAALAGRRRLFLAALAVYLLAFPPVLSALNLAVPRRAITYGFSAIDMALAGLLPVLLAAYASERTHPWVRVREAPLLYFLVMALVPLVALPLRETTVAIAVGAGAVAVLYAASVERRRRRTDGHLLPADAGDGYLAVGIFGAVVAVGYPLIGFPTGTAAGDAVVNLYVHLLGYSLAFVVPYVALELGLFRER